MSFAHWTARQVWNRRTAWILIVLASLVTLWWQWENWRSARELAAAHDRIMNEIGTDDPLSLEPERVPPEANFFVNSVFESWLIAKPDAAVGVTYAPPENALLPDDFIRPTLTVGVPEGSADILDLSVWRERCAQAGKPLLPDESTDEALARELGDGNGFIPRLAAVLNRPYSQMRPGRREALEASGGNPFSVDLPDFRRLLDFQDQLGLHLRSASRVGDAGKAVDTAQIMLRVSESMKQHALVGCLVSLGAHHVTFSAMHEALAHPIWSERDLTLIQTRLAQMDDLEILRHALQTETLQMFQGGLWVRSHPGYLFEHPNGVGGSPLSWDDTLFAFLERWGPVGWTDANIAFYTECMLDTIGPDGPDAWLTAGQRSADVWQRVKLTWPNPRRVLGAVAIPSLPDVWSDAAFVLFCRRSLIIACELEKFRGLNGSFPPTLEAVAKDLAHFNVSDPAALSNTLNYRLEEGGYVLWSAGDDGLDQGGKADKDWLWRMRRVPVDRPQN